MFEQPLSRDGPVNLTCRPNMAHMPFVALKCSQLPAYAVHRSCKRADTNSQFGCETPERVQAGGQACRRFIFVRMHVACMLGVLEGNYLDKYLYSHCRSNVLLLPADNRADPVSALISINKKFQSYGKALLGSSSRQMALQRQLICKHESSGNLYGPKTRCSWH